MSTKAAAKITLLDGGGNQVRSIDLAGPVTVGRHPDNTIPLGDELASRFHCTFEPDGKGGWRVRDLGSRNGTRVNDRAIDDHPLQPGDRVRVGRHTMVFGLAPAGATPSLPDSLNDTMTGGDAGPDADADAEPALSPVRRRRKARTETVDASVDEPPPSVKLPPWAKDLERIARTLAYDSNERIETVHLLDGRGKRSDALMGDSTGSLAMRMLLLAASSARATDMHLEPKGESAQVRFRVDGQMVTLLDLPRRVGDTCVGLVKAACHMKTAGRDAVLDGHFGATFPDRRVDYRASLTPSVHGQKMVLRVLDPRMAPHSLDELGIAPYTLERLKKVCRQDSGLLLVSGPTGSGKTTTLYNALREIDRSKRNVITIEDPVEYQIEGVTQIPLDIGAGATFGSILRSVLRQDPDVILIGEIRDEETARLAMQAAMTGHVVFTTVHSKDTIGAVFRLLDLGIEPYLVANSLDLILAQRLVRVLCDHCKRQVRVTPGQATRMGKYLEGKHQVYAATGCARCLRTGYKGRQGVYEMLEFTNELRDVVLGKPTIQEMRRVIEHGMFTTLQQSAWQFVARGTTSLEEADRVTGGI